MCMCSILRALLYSACTGTVLWHNIYDVHDMCTCMVFVSVVVHSMNVTTPLSFTCDNVHVYTLYMYDMYIHMHMCSIT